MFSPEYLLRHVSIQSRAMTHQAGIRDVQEPILILVLFVYTAHQGSSGRKYFIDEDEDSFLGRELDALADYVDELAHGEVGGDQILLFVDSCDI